MKQSGEHQYQTSEAQTYDGAGVPDLSHIVKAYDIRGVVPDQLDQEIARAFGAAFVLVTGANAAVVGYDMRPSSPGLAAAFAAGATGQGADVIDIGLASTDQLYFASGVLDLPGAMFTASHNPARYNGIKLCRAGAAPIGQDTGLAEIRAYVEDGVPGYAGEPGTVAAAGHAGGVRRGTCARWWTCPASGRSPWWWTRATAWAATRCRPCSAGLPLEVVPLYFELDGTFPNHEANPLDPENLVDLQAKVRETGADLGTRVRRRRRSLLRGRRERRVRSRRPRSPRWWPPGNWPRSRARRSSTT